MTVDVAECLTMARKAAYRMSQDPEMGSIAGSAAWSAARSYDGTIPLEAWVAYNVKVRVWSWQRRCAARREVPLDAEAAYLCTWDEPLDTPWTPEYKLLVERYIEQKSVYALARQHGTSMRQMRRMLKDAAQQL